MDSTGSVVLFPLNEYISNTHKTEGKEFDADDQATAYREPKTAAVLLYTVTDNLYSYNCMALSSTHCLIKV